jgi:hypothetical protein
MHHLCFNYRKHNEINMNKIARLQPVIRRRPIGCLFTSSTSRAASGQEHELREMSPVSALHIAFLLYGLRNARTRSDVHSVVLVRTNTLINEANVVTEGAALNLFALQE